MLEFDSIIIGSGQAAPSLAVGLARRGDKVALIEGDRLGGTCVNTGCTPTKTLRKSARVAHLARRAADFAVTTGQIEVDFLAAMERMRARSDAAREGLTSWLEGTEGITLVQGWGRFAGREVDGRFRVMVGDQGLLARQVYLNTGTRPFLPPVPGIDTIIPLNNASLLALTERPDHLIVVGGSYIGLELGQIFRRLGSQVTILHRADRLAEREDADVSGIIADIMRAEGIDLRLNAPVDSVGKSMRGVMVTLEDGTELSGSHILFATGRVPNTDELNLASVGLTADKRGYIVTDAQLRTEVPGIWALGDINRRGAFTHTSYHDHEIVLAHRDGLTDLHQWQGADARITTYAMFTDPPLGRVGLTRAEAQALVANGQRILISDLPMERVSRAKEEGETIGLIRLIVDAESERFLGATVFGFAGDEIIAALTNFMATGASYRIMQQALPVHPTVAEFLPTILAGLKPLEATDG
ncbi:MULTISPECIES: mercuric reductase [Paracoccaceae]|jgi:pyruvate/2-oxoglutarate dehydrogenase complex dihydrolipoamide dehydrogenase (E3) component|uniref:mercuric reductase n=1 Tax=Paracoccaceae TaxID=31989 RepID=UPI00112793DF|nr:MULTISPECIES: mercuric reductase [Paracoccaceae]HQU67356.1 mercuric reductase [Albidovulum sp.]